MFRKSSKALHLWTVEDPCGSDCQKSQQKCRVTFLSPFQDGSPKLPSKPNWEMTHLTRSCYFFACQKNGLSQFPLWMKMYISVCNFNFTADWHLQRQRILIKLQKHLIQWLADGEKVCRNSIFLLTKHGMCFSKAWTLFHLLFKSDDSKPWLGLLRGNAVYHLNGLIIYRSSPPPAPFPIRQISILGSAPNKVTQGNFKKLSECNTASINYLCTLDLEIKQQWSVL